MKKPLPLVWSAALALTLLLAACGGGGSGDPIIEGPQLPVARISGIAASYPVNALVQLDGRNSSDFQGLPLTYSWSLIQKPVTSNAALSSPDSPNPTLRPDVEGRYDVRLVVNNGTQNSLPATATFTAFVTTTPIADAGPSPRTVGIGFPVALNASDSLSPTGAALTYAWSLQQRPAGSTATITAPSEVATSFTPDVPGEYLVALSVNNGQNSATTQISINAVAAFFRTYGGTGDEFGRPVAELPGVGYLLAGESDSPDISQSGSWDMAVLRTNLAGIQTGTFSFGGSGIDETWAMDVNAAANRIALAGYTESFDNLDDAILIESDLNGDQIGATQTFGGTEPDLFQAVRYTTDGGMILCGYSESQPFNPLGEGSAIMIIKLAADGTVQFNETVGYGGAGIEDCWGIVETATGYTLAGFTNSQGDPDAYLLKIDRDGVVQWERSFGQAGFYDEFYDLKATTDDGYIAAGYTRSFGDSLAGDMYLVKVDDEGTLQWELPLGGDDFDEAREVQQTGDGHFAIAGYTYSFGDGENAEAYLAKVRTDGSSVLLWEKTYGMPNASAEAWSLIQTSDGGFLMGGDIYLPGRLDLDWMLIKTDAEGRVPPISRPYDVPPANEGSVVNILASENFDVVQGEPGTTRALTFTAIGLPEGISIDSDTGAISGTLPQVTADRVYPITIIATDPDGLSASETLNLTVRNVN